jgi:AcrR family transcriptional regulator
MISNEDIKQVALVLFANKGFTEATTDDIANALGLKKQSLYSHFRNKNQILLEVVKDQSHFVYHELQLTICLLTDKAASILLKGILDKIIEIFSDKNRLLLWKRIFLIKKDDDNYNIIQNCEWRFDKLLREELQACLLNKYTYFQNPKNIRSFFTRYMVIIHGYLDWMLVDEHDDLTWQVMWNCFWDNHKKYFT